MPSVSLPVGTSHGLPHSIEDALTSRRGDVDAQSASPSREILAEADGGAPRRHTSMLLGCASQTALPGTWHMTPGFVAVVVLGGGVIGAIAAYSPLHNAPWPAGPIGHLLDASMAGPPWLVGLSWALGIAVTWGFGWLAGMLVPVMALAIAAEIRQRRAGQPSPDPPPAFGPRSGGPAS